MIFTQRYLARLPRASYLTGDGRPGPAVVVDPGRGVDVYLGEASPTGPNGTRLATAATQSNRLRSRWNEATREPGGAMGLVVAP